MDSAPESPMMRVSPIYSYVRSRQLEGTFPGGPETGVWSISTLRIGYGWGMVPEEAWPSDGSLWPPKEPPGTDVVASGHRSGPYWRVRTLDECKAVLANFEVPMLSIEITQDWFDAPNGRIAARHLQGAPAGKHSVILAGYDDLSSELKFQNSWGQSWGDQGFGYLPYSLFENIWWEGWMLCPPSGASAPECIQSSMIMRSWEMHSHNGDEVMHCRELSGRHSERMAWGFALERESSIEIEELFVHPQYRKAQHGRTLLQEFVELASETHKTLILWISFADAVPENMVAIERLGRQHGLKLLPSKERWAHALLGRHCPSKA